MSYQFEEGGIYRMPTHFGQVSGARNIPAHVIQDHARYPEVTRFSIHFLTDAALLAKQLPAKLRLAGEPIVTIYFATMKNIQWLAGRGYNVLSYSFPVIYSGESKTVTTNFKAVLWEALPDACISGREDLGFNKLWADIPDPRIFGDVYHYEASWLGFKFIEAQFHASGTATSLPAIPGRADAKGTLNHKYIPKSGHRGAHDSMYFTYWPEFEVQNVQRILIGRGDFHFNRATWEQLPTMHHVINQLAALPVMQTLSATLTFGSGQGAVGNLEILP